MELKKTKLLEVEVRSYRQERDCWRFMRGQQGYSSGKSDGWLVGETIPLVGADDVFIILDVSCLVTG